MKKLIKKLKVLIKNMKVAVADLNPKHIKISLGVLLSLVGAGTAVKVKNHYNQPVVQQKIESKKYRLMVIENGQPVGVFLVENVKIPKEAVCGIDIRDNSEMCVKTSGFLLKEIKD